MGKQHNYLVFNSNAKPSSQFTTFLVWVPLRTTMLLGLLLYGSNAMALGFGEMHLQSLLGQPLLAQIGLVNGGTEFEKRCFKARLNSLDGALLGQVNFDLNKDGASPAIDISTSQALNEPVAILSVEYSCASTQTRRDYQILLDLPITAATVESPKPATLPESAEKRVMAPLKQQNSHGAKGAGIASKKMHHHQSVDPVLTEIPRTRSRSASDSDTKEKGSQEKIVPRDKTTSAKAFRNVLRLGDDASIANNLNGEGMHLAMSRGLRGSALALETKPAGTGSEPVLTAVPPQIAPVNNAAPATATAAVPVSGQDNSSVTATAPATATTPVTPPAVDAGLQELQAKIRVMEVETDELRKLNARHLADLKAEQQNKESGSSVFYLYFLLLASFIAIAWLVWRTRQIKSNLNNASWDQMVPEHDQPIGHGTQHVEEEDPFFDNKPAPEVKTVVMVKPAAKAIANNSNNEPVDYAFSSKGAPARTPMSPPLIMDEPGENDYKFYGNVRTALPNAEEILDEIQQAEFWMDMQQPQRAIEILESNWGTERPSSPLPWLYLFDLYRMVGDRDKYNELTERFEEIFNGKVIPWGDGDLLPPSRSLEDFPFLINKIIELWPTDELVPFMENLLIDDRDGRRQGFDLGAYRDILFLTNIAYELQEAQGAKSSVSGPDWSIIQ